MARSAVRTGRRVPGVVARYFLPLAEGADWRSHPESKGQ